MKPYEYRTKNKSYLSSGFVNYLAIPMAAVFPKSVPANIISSIGHLTIYGALLLSFYPIPSKNINLVIMAVLIIVQLIFDKIDGIIARKTETDSPLGEFIDHFFELFNQGAIILIVYNIYVIGHASLVIVLTALACLGNMTKYYEQYRTNFLVISKVSFFEIKIILVFVLLFSNIQGFYDFLNASQIFGYTVVEYALILILGALLLVFIFTVKRIPFTTYGLWLFLLLLIVVAYFSFFSYNLIAAVTITLFYGILYVGRLLFTQLVDGLERSPDLFIPIFMGVHFFTGYFDQNNTLLIILLYLIVNILLVIIKTCRALSKYWYWRH